MFGVSGLQIERLRQAGSYASRVAISYGLWSALWVAGHCTGGVIVGAVLGAVGACLSLTEQTWTWIVASVLVLGALHHIGILRVPMPQMHRQVPRHWMFCLRPSWVAVGYGVQLGCAVATRITNFATYAALVSAMSTGSPIRGALIMAAFGFARALPAVVAGPFGYSPERSFAVAFRFGVWEEWLHKASGIVLLVVALILSSIKCISL
jgi:cytochrome c biogenesis protein CcdA